MRQLYRKIVPPPTLDIVSSVSCIAVFAIVQVVRIDRLVVAVACELRLSDDTGKRLPCLIRIEGHDWIIWNPTVDHLYNVDLPLWHGVLPVVLFVVEDFSYKRFRSFSGLTVWSGLSPLVAVLPTPVTLGPVGKRAMASAMPAVFTAVAHLVSR